MVIVRLMGGLGNQMFQYAAGRRLAQKNNTDLKLDLSWFDSIAVSETPRHYELHPFAIKEAFASAREVARLRRKRDVSSAGIVRRLLAAKISPSGSTHIGEKHYHFDHDILKLRGDVYLEGYWQSEKYFKDIEDVIRREFTVRVTPDERNRQMADVIRDADAVSIHVRRGDYASHPGTGAFHGTCSLDYYRAAVEKIASHASQPHFFVFSDDPQWVKENLKLPFPMTFADHNDPDHGFEDLRLMSLCRHHIVANSSFSWWGAWLCSNPDKIVIAPRQWFKTKDLNTDDLIPEKWIKI